MALYECVDDRQESIDYEKLYKKLSAAVKQMNAVYAACAAEEELAARMAQKRMLEKYGLSELPEED